MDKLELAACTPVPIDTAKFNPLAAIPYGCTVDHVQASMHDFVEFLGFINRQLFAGGIQRLETMLMPANFSSVVGEFMNTTLPKHCPTLAKNQFHNGHPDLIPSGMFPNNAVRYAHDGIEIKASRYSRGWQGHNVEASWLMVFVFESDRPARTTDTASPSPFRFRLVAGAQLQVDDWRFAGRSATSRRTITASVTQAGYEKMMANWIYRDDGN